MDVLRKHTAFFQRNHPSFLPLQTIGFLPQKKEWVYQKFPTYNFSFILQGEGTYKFNGKTFRVQAPMVITQWPGAYLEYGPSKSSKSWDEVYFIYESKSHPVIQKQGFMLNGQWGWPIVAIDKTMKILQELYDICHQENVHLVGDWIDRLAELAILSSYEKPSHRPVLEIDKKLESIERVVRKQYRETLDFKKISQSHGFSYVHFRSVWKKRYGVPPGRFQTNLRIHEASRLLVETLLRVSEISEQLGWDDALYFSRKFRAITKKSPSEYRQIHQLVWNPVKIKD
ncbi:MAG: AraC family transcriptional regulator [Verrucomicrobiota bacterium]